MKKSQMLAEAEAQEKSSSTRMPDIDIDFEKFIQQKDGFYEVDPIRCTGDYVAIAPFRRNVVTEGGIVVPTQVDARPDTGLIVGLGENIGNLQLGQHVKFIPKHKAADLTGEFPFYDKAEIAVYKLVSVVAILPQVEAKMMDRVRTYQ